LLYDEETLAQVGPSRFWKELHSPYRRPEQMPPTFGAPVAGRFLDWDPTGSTVATAFGTDALVLWGLPRQTTLASAVPQQLRARHVKGFESPVAAAAFAPGGGHLGALDRDGRPYAVRLVDGGGDARPLAKEPPEGGARLLAMLDGGALTFGDGGQVRFWPVGQTLGGAEPELIREERGRFDVVDVDPTGRWVLAAVDGGDPVRPERWKTLVLIPHRAGRPGQGTVIGGGAFWSRARFSPDGGWLAISRREGTEVWRLSEEPQRFLNADAGSPVRFSPDSRLVQVGRELYSLDGPAAAQLARRGSEQALLRSLSSLDRDELWRGFDLERARQRGDLWRRPPIRVPPHGVQQVRASIDGRWTLATGAPWQLHLWYFGDESLGALAPPTGEALISSRRVHWATSGPSPASSWPAGRVEALSRESGSSLFRGVCGVVGRSLTRDEWRRFYGDEPYRRTCDRPR
ncbi:MAG: hypothetical protein AAFX50_02525, partial [Acidobacteriota bacterium]